MSEGRNLSFQELLDAVRELNPALQFRFIVNEKDVMLVEQFIKPYEVEIGDWTVSVPYEAVDYVPVGTYLVFSDSEWKVGSFR